MLMFYRRSLKLLKVKQMELSGRIIFTVNILGMISCDDLSKSTYDENMPGHYIFNELAIHTEKKTKDILLFRLQEHSPTIVIHKSVLNYI